ncbi:outer membrane protein [Vibrio caribbeanicus]|uniref:Outer membrane protein beta-barrel domain-containing protein n=1 Tax=Vibrio caribbeanicus ATCC BAA-2122 TaxID=796620 RepID=E3BIE2_9VIBR|nr:outer membrane beta-barrel protein [Vibrio caribbeanicus]EFP97150.1 hypothetical protein VIBC2010_08942 [Vibrio caribbeanicus ATCC BAA-2122]
MKKIVLGAIAALFSISSYANDTYIAVELGGGSYNISGEDSNAKFARDLEDVGFLNIKLGQSLNEGFRYYGYIQHGGDTTVKYTYNNVDVFDYNLTTYEFGLGGDYIHDITDKFYALGGVNLGLYKSNFEISFIGLPTEDSSNTGMAAGLNLGLGYSFTEHFGIELGYRHTRFSSNKHEIKKSGYDVDLSFDATNMAYLNLNYTF